MSVLGILWLTQLVAVLSADPTGSVVAKVNGTAITTNDVDFAALQQGLSDEQKETDKSKLLDQLIDRQLIRAFLASKKVSPVADELQFQIAQAEDLIRKRNEDPVKVLAKIGYTPERLKAELGLPLAWQVYARQTITAEQIKAYFQGHKQELDGTQLRVSQIFLKLPKPAADSQIAEKKATLNALRDEITKGKQTFSDAAKAHSEAPTRNEGGDVGLIGWRGKLPPTVSKTAFDLKVGDVSEPIESPFGIHLIKVTERHPGDFSLEDVRTVILDRLSQQLWTDTVAKERTSAKIERPKS